MTGQIPKYGANFRLDDAGYHPELSRSVYVLKTDRTWFIRSDRTSKKWGIYHGAPFNDATPVNLTYRTLTLAMEALVNAIEASVARHPAGKKRAVRDG